VVWISSLIVRQGQFSSRLIHDAHQMLLNWKCQRDNILTVRDSGIISLDVEEPAYNTVMCGTAVFSICWYTVHH